MHSHHRYRNRCFFTGVLVTALIASTISYAQRYRADEVEIQRLRQEQLAEKQQNQQDVQKVKNFYLKKNPRLWDSLALEMAEATVAAAKHHQVPLEIQVAVNACESEIHPFAVSPTGAKGLGQVDFNVWREELGDGNPFEPTYNQRGVSYVLSRNLRLYGLKKGLEIYNLGEGNFKRGKRARQYVSRVFEQASEFRYMTL